MASLKDKRIIVTGAASGMGAEMVRAFAHEGAQVAAFYRTETGDGVLARLPEAERRRVRFLRCDVADKGQVWAAVDEAVGWMGGLDVLANSAGVAPGGAAESITLEAWLDVMASNATGTFLTNQAVFPHLKEKGGAILNFASGVGVRGHAGKAHYAASKGAVLAWTRSVAAAWGRYGITVNAICPAIWTPMYEKTRASLSPEALAEHDAQRAKSILIGGKLGDPERDFAPYMVFLAGDGARFITGQTIHINGGSLM